jgi:outer membrane protein OmpA-like peptidoglycan-associated protein
MSGDWGSHETSPFERLDHAAFYNISGGPKFTYRTHHVSPFAEILAGGHRLTPELFHPDDEFGFMAGGGIDVNITRHFAFRLIRADYVYSNHQFGSSPAVPPTDLRGVRLQSGVVFMFGGGPAVIAHTVVAPPAPPPPPPVAPVTPVIDPPTVTCSANPAEVNPGESSSITANATSPQNRPLTYSYSSTAGSISGTSPTTTLSTAGAASGVITVTCSVEDDKGNMSSQTAQVMVAAPAVAAKPATTPLCSVTFDRDDRRPARVDNEAKACLDDIALNLQRSADATLGVIGNSAAQGGSNKLAAQRAVNTKAYLVTEKGIDPTRIATYTGTQNANLVSTTLIPPGATLDTTGDTAVDENQFKASSHAAGHGSRVLSH